MNLKVKKCAARKMIFCTGLTRAAKAGQKSIVPVRQAQRTNQGRAPVICPQGGRGVSEVFRKNKKGVCYHPR